jgi:hypothetical protein
MPNAVDYTLVGAPSTLIVSGGAYPQYIKINSDKSYTLAHDGETNAGIPSTSTIYFSFGASNNPTPVVDASPAEGASKLKLISGRAIALPPNITYLGFAISGNSSTPTFTITPSDSFLGKV